MTPTTHPDDDADELAPFAAHFSRPPGRLYLDGNSLGLLCRPAEAALLDALDEWKTQAIDAWTDAAPPWFTLAEEISALVAPLVGARPNEVIVANSTTVNLHQLLATLYAPTPTRAKILLDALAFPSDLYAAASFLRGRGLDPATHLVTAPSADGYTLDESALIAALTPDIALAVLPSVVYTSGQLLDIPRLSDAARQRGILTAFDLSHSIGVVPHAVGDWDIDSAFWCHYKYLNGGPGAPGGLYLNRRHFAKPPGLAGWFGSDKRFQFDMAPAFTPAPGAGALQIGTPSVLALAPLRGALSLVADAGIDRLRLKSLKLTASLMALSETELSPHGVSLATPRADARRGGHVALLHPEAARLCKALKAHGVTPDYRAPDIIRLAPAPLYTSFADCRAAIAHLKRILDEGLYAHYPSGRALVA